MLTVYLWDHGILARNLILVRFPWRLVLMDALVEDIAATLIGEAVPLF